MVESRLDYLEEWREGTAPEAALAVALKEDMVEASAEEEDRVLDEVDYMAPSVVQVEVVAVVSVRVVQVAAALKAACAEVSEEVKVQVVAPAAVMAPVLALEVASEEVLVVAPEAWEEVTVASNSNVGSFPSNGKKTRSIGEFLVNKFICIQK